jgi:tetratricopeptide (TPR) repeat protein
MKKILLLLFVSLSITNIHAQTHEIDSLRQALQNEKTDSGRVLLLADLAFKYFESKPDTAMTLAIQGLELSREIHYEKGEAVSLNRIGNNYEILGNYPKALAVYLQALAINEKINNLDGEQRNLNNLGVVYNDIGDFRFALQYYFKAKSTAEKINNKFLLSLTLDNMGQTYLNLLAFDSATVLAQQAYNIGMQLNNSKLCGGALSSLGKIYFKMGQNKLALDYCQLSTSYLETGTSYNTLSTTYLIIANVFEKLNEKDSVLIYGRQAFITAKARGFTLESRDAAILLSQYYRKYNADSSFYYQDISKAMNDSLFTQVKQRDIQSMEFDEKMRQSEQEIKKLKEEENRKRNLQYAAIAVALITILILFFTLSRSIIVKEKFIEFFGILALLAVFEFINLFINPYLVHATNDSPVLMLLILISIGALLAPLHHRLEKWITHRLVEKNKKIRLTAAKKTIQQLEG